MSSVWTFYHHLCTILVIYLAVVACATVKLNTYSLAWPAYRPGYDPGLCAKIRSRQFWRVRYRINILGSQLSPSSINLVPAQAGKAIVGLAWHWPYITDTVVYPPTGSTAKDREMSTHAYAPSGRGTIYRLPLPLPFTFMYCFQSWLVTWCRLYAHRCQ